MTDSKTPVVFIHGIVAARNLVGALAGTVRRVGL
jgi:hypothetical protein